MRRIISKIMMVTAAAATAISMGGYIVVDNGLLEAESEGIAELRKQKSDGVSTWLDHQVAWLSLYDTNINYPVMQTDNNEWYLNHDYYGNDSATGAVFLDYRNSTEFDDAVTLVYGHRTNGRLMFSDIARFSDEKFFEEHRDGELILPKQRYRLRVVAFREISTNDRLYSELSFDYFARPIIVLSTCNRNVRDSRSVLVLEATSE